MKRRAHARWQRSTRRRTACLAGTAQALCTAPLSKERAALSSPGFVGHTERLALATGTRVAMMMAGPRAARGAGDEPPRARGRPAQRSRPRRLPSSPGSPRRSCACRWNIPSPRLAVCGLNPHAGDGGLFGDEDARIVAPAIREARASGVDASGPWPADGLFPRAAKGEFDAVVALYHDQGLIPAKLLDFAETVNVTLGLPFPEPAPTTAPPTTSPGRAKPIPHR